MARDLAAQLHVAGGLLFLALWALVVANLGLDSSLLRAVGEGVLALVVLLASWRASRHIRILAAIMAAATVTVAVSTGEWQFVQRGLGSALAIAAFLPVIVLLRATVEASPAVTAMRQRLASLSGAERRAWATGSAHLLGSILTLGFVSVQRPMLPTALDDTERISLAECGVRGLGLSVLWSPFFVASAVAGQLVPGVQVWQTVMIGLALATLGGALAHFMFNRVLDLPSFGRALRRLVPLFLPTTLLVGAVVATSAVTGWNVLQSVIVVIPIACIGYVGSHAGARLKPVLARVVTGAGRMGDEVLILTVSSVFAGAVSGTRLPPEVSQGLAVLAGHPWLVITLQVALMTTLGIIGLHPIVSAAILVPLALVMLMPIAPPVLAHIVVLSWSLSGMMAAWTLPVVVTAAAFDVPVRRLVFGANMRFVLVFGLLACAALSLLNVVSVEHLLSACQQSVFQGALAMTSIRPRLQCAS